jgi:hypothetical protein
MEPKKYVTIQGLLQEGNNYTEDVETSKGVFQIRPMTLGEKAEIQVNSMAGVKAGAKTDAFSKDGKGELSEADVNIDLTEMQKAQWEAKFKVLAYGLSTGKQRYNSDTIKRVSLTTADVDTLYQRIMAISEVTPDELVPFRQDEDGDGDGASNDDGSSIS